MVCTKIKQQKFILRIEARIWNSMRDLHVKVQIHLNMTFEINGLTSALTTNFHILVSRGGRWLGINRTIKF